MANSSALEALVAQILEAVLESKNELTKSVLTRGVGISSDILTSGIGLSSSINMNSRSAEQVGQQNPAEVMRDENRAARAEAQWQRRIARAESQAANEGNGFGEGVLTPGGTNSFIAGGARRLLGANGSRSVGLGLARFQPGIGALGASVAGATVAGAVASVGEAGMKFAKRSFFGALEKQVDLGGSFGTNLSASMADAYTQIPIIGKAGARKIDPIDRAFDRSSAIAGILGRGGNTNVEGSMEKVRERFLAEERRAEENIIKEDRARAAEKARVNDSELVSGKDVAMGALSIPSFGATFGIYKLGELIGRRIGGS